MISVVPVLRVPPCNISRNRYKNDGRGRQIKSTLVCSLLIFDLMEIKEMDHPDWLLSMNHLISTRSKAMNCA